MIETDHIVVALVGFFATMVGLYSFITRSTKEDEREKQRLNHIEIMVQNILAIDRKLEDVLNHPDISGFGDKEVLKTQSVIVELLKEIQKEIQHYANKR